MAVVSKNPINSIFSVKNLLLSISVIFMALILKLYAPYVFEAFVSGVPAMRSWFTRPYLYVVVNFIIIAIAASSRFQQRMEEEMSELMASAKVQQADVHKETYDVVGRKNSVERKTEFGGMEAEMYFRVEVNQKQSTNLQVKSKSKPVEAMDSEVQIKKKPVEPKRELEVKRKKKPVEPREFEVFKPRKYDFLERKNLEVDNKMERSAKEGEDQYTRLKSVEVSKQTSTVEIPVDYSLKEISDRPDSHDYNEEVLQAGKQVSAAEGEEEENDTLDGTWKMIMESRRIHEAALQEESNNARSPSHSRDTYNY